jgi:deoxycytidine triphosphate deaminase
MSIVDLSVRLTDNEKLFGDFNKSRDSLILVRPLVKPDGSSVDLSVGEYWFDCENERDYAIGEDGFELHPNGFAVIETFEEVALPQNVFGLLTGKGKHIFRGILISAGKIDPTFRDRLRIGVFNAGRESIILKKVSIYAHAASF